jgi:hypothetical protein
MKFRERARKGVDKKKVSRKEYLNTEDFVEMK